MNILDIVFPRICAGCGREGAYVCQACIAKLKVVEQICPNCGGVSMGGYVHARCRTEWGMERLVVGLPYKGVVQKCLKQVKYKSAWEIVGFLYGKWQENNRETVPGGMVITSVPMWRGKERERGFNQAEILARLIASENKVPYLVMLSRVRATSAMFGLDKKQRATNIMGAFECIKQLGDYESRTEKVILVDDVWTTGATMRECAKTLKQAGVKVVVGMTLAR